MQKILKNHHHKRIFIRLFLSMHCLLCLLHYNVRVLSLCRGFVTTELVCLYLSRRKNRHGHWVCWMSNGRKNGSMSCAGCAGGGDKCVPQHDHHQHFIVKPCASAQKPCNEARPRERIDRGHFLPKHSSFYCLRELYEADFHKPEIYGSG